MSAGEVVSIPKKLFDEIYSRLSQHGAVEFELAKDNTPPTEAGQWEPPTLYQAIDFIRNWLPKYGRWDMTWTNKRVSDCASMFLDFLKTLPPKGE